MAVNILPFMIIPAVAGSLEPGCNHRIFDVRGGGCHRAQGDGGAMRRLGELHFSHTPT
ncbi:MAG: hypothetical protein ACN6QY_02990 [Pseudomonas sp.]|uniref:hypothetical protein n=1 Tax=Pseudomonas sp. TaxID=306 RepID=UPI000A71D215